MLAKRQVFCIAKNLWIGRLGGGINLKFGFKLAKRQVCVLRWGWCYEFGFKLAKRQVFVNENLRLGLLGGINLKNLGFILAKPVVCGKRKLQGLFRIGLEL
ncbi:MAG: hypothetical protein GX297_03335 [Treponema sp.]|jgi:hypothetical protein|nr:hypothetical protein [Treponema sp.]